MMGRVFVYLLILVLTVFLLSSALIFRNGGDPSEEVMQVSIHDLSTAPQAHAETRVETTGVLRLTEEPAPHFLVTAQGLGIVVRDYDEGELRALDGRIVTVIGRFGFDEAAGTFIETDSVTPAR
jgi:hypothetical protein